MIAAQRGHPECISILLDHGADLNVSLEVSACSYGCWAYVVHEYCSIGLGLVPHIYDFIIIVSALIIRMGLQLS
jgi:hypothetical protein